LPHDASSKGMLTSGSLKFGTPGVEVEYVGDARSSNMLKSVDKSVLSQTMQLD